MQIVYAYFIEPGSGFASQSNSKRSQGKRRHGDIIESKEMIPGVQQELLFVYFMTFYEDDMLHFLFRSFIILWS